MHDIITVTECLAFMESGRPFSCKVVTYDRKKKQGGVVVDYPEAVLVQNDKPRRQARAATKREATEVAVKKIPSHRKWYTRNIRILQQGHHTAMVRKVHPPLFLQFNQKSVVP